MKLLSYKDYLKESYNYRQDSLNEYVTFVDLFKDVLRAYFFNGWGLMWSLYLEINKRKRIKYLLDKETDPDKKEQLRKELNFSTRNEVKLRKQMEEAKEKSKAEYNNLSSEEKKKIKAEIKPKAEQLAKKIDDINKKTKEFINK